MTIKFTLGPASIDAAIEQITAYQKKVERLGDKITGRLTEGGVQTARDVAMYMNAFDSGELVNGIIAEYRDGKGYVHSTAPHSAYVEMGTGVVGSRSPGQTMPGWQYDVNEHGEDGWYYIGKDGKRHWTKGMPSRPFMYDTAQILRESIPYIGEEAMND